jgi:hypothetical protein
VDFSAAEDGKPLETLLEDAARAVVSLPSMAIRPRSSLNNTPKSRDRNLPACDFVRTHVGECLPPSAQPVDARATTAEARGDSGWTHPARQ